MGYLWHELRLAIPLIFSNNSYVLSVTWVTIKVALVSTGAALVIGLPIGLAIGLGRFRGRRALHVLANVSLATPPVLVGVFVLLLLLPRGLLGGLRLEFTLRGVYIAQTFLALPYIVALVPAAIQGLPPGLLAQARVLGAGRRQLALLSLREAKIGVLAAVIAAFGTTLSELSAVLIVGGGIAGRDQTLAVAVLGELTENNDYPGAIAVGLVLLVLILVLLGILTALQQRTEGIQLRFRTST